MKLVEYLFTNKLMFSAVPHTHIHTHTCTHTDAYMKSKAAVQTNDRHGHVRSISVVMCIVRRRKILLTELVG